MFRTISAATITLAAGFGFGLASGAGASDTTTKPAVVSVKTPTSCLLALESAWKTINQTPTGEDHKAAFDASYATCLQES